MWLGEKFQSNPEIAGSPRNSFRASVEAKRLGGRALNVRWPHPGVLSIIKLRMPGQRYPAVRLWVIRSMVERETAQTAS